MPKSVKNIINFSGGINTDLSAKIIPDESLVECVNLNIENPGKIFPVAGFKSSTLVASMLNPDSCLYSFRTDNNSDTPAEYVLIQTTNGVIRRYDKETDTLLNSISTTNEKGMIYSNGVLFLYPVGAGTPRVYKAGNFTDAGEFQLDYDSLKPVTRLTLNGDHIDGVSAGTTEDVTFRLFEDVNLDGFATGDIDVSGDTTSGAYVYLNYNGAEYYCGNIASQATTADWLTALVTGINDSGAPLEASENGTILTVRALVYGADGNGDFTLYERVSAGGDYGNFLYYVKLTGGGVESQEDVSNIDKLLESGKYSFYASLVLWDGSETNIEGTKCNIVFDERTKLRTQIFIDDISIFDDDFVKGVKIYLGSESFEPSLLCEYRHDVGNSRFKFYNESDFSTDNSLSSEVDIVLPLRSTFRFESGYDVGERASPSMREFVIVNNRGYALNVNYGDEYHQDRIIISPQGKPFLLPEENSIDIVTEDGDEYVTAKSFGSFLYCFKRQTLFILNISSNDPSSFYLADSSFGVGVNGKSAVCKTEIGIFWANENGMYYHNGEGQVNNISINKVQNDWESLNSDRIRVGYDPINKKVLFIRGYDIFCFDIRNNAFSKLDSMTSSLDRSNFTVINKKLSLFHNDSIKQFSLDRDVVPWSIVTKDFDLGRRAVRKKVRRFYVTFAEQNINLPSINFYYSLDNTNNFINLQGVLINKDDGVNKNTLAMFDLPRSITAYSVQLKIESSLDVTIKDISIIYRDKLPK